MTAVKFFHSGMTGAPTLNALAGSIVSILDACLVSGFGLVSVDSLMVSGGVATATISAGHSALQHSVVLIAGAGVAGIDGERRVAGVTASTVQFPVPGVPDSSVSGAITLKLAPLGWSKPHGGAMIAAYAPTDPQASGCLVRVDDSNTAANWNYGSSAAASVMGVESMTDIDTYAGGFGATWWTKHDSTAGTEARDWVLIGDSRAFYLVTYAAAVSGSSGGVHAGSPNFFGDINSFVPGDAYGAMLVGSHNYTGTSGALAGYCYRQSSLFLLDSPVSGSRVTGGRALARAYTQLSGGLAASLVGSALGRYVGRSNALEYPNGPGNALALHEPLLVMEAVARARGTMPGLAQVLHNKPVTHLSIQAIAGRQYLFVTANADDSSATTGSTYSGQGAFLISEPWR